MAAWFEVLDRMHSQPTEPIIAISGYGANMRLAIALAVPLLIIPLACSDAESTDTRVKQLLVAIAADDANHVEKLLETPELSIDQRYGQNFTWTHAAAMSCSTQAMIKLRKLGVPLTGDEGDIVVWQMDDPQKTDKCGSTARLGLPDWKFGEEDRIAGNFRPFSSDCGGPHGNGASISYLVSHGAITGTPLSGRNVVQDAAGESGYPNCLAAFQGLFVVFHHPAENLGSNLSASPPKPAYDGPAAWVVAEAKAVDRFGNTAIDLVGPFLVAPGDPLAKVQQKQSANWAVARDILIRNGSPPAKIMTRAACLQEVWAPNPVGQSPSQQYCP